MLVDDIDIIMMMESSRPVVNPCPSCATFVFVSSFWVPRVTAISLPVF